MLGEMLIRNHVARMEPNGSIKNYLLRGIQYFYTK